MEYILVTGLSPEGYMCFFKVYCNIILRLMFSLVWGEENSTNHTFCSFSMSEVCSVLFKSRQSTVY